MTEPIKDVSHSRREDDDSQPQDSRRQTPQSVADRRASERRAASIDRRVGLDRRRGPGRRRSDDRRSAEEGEMTDDQFELLMAIEDYKEVNRKPFPTLTEILDVIKALGYRKVAKPQNIR